MRKRPALLFYQRIISYFVQFAPCRILSKRRSQFNMNFLLLTLLALIGLDPATPVQGCKAPYRIVPLGNFYFMKLSPVLYITFLLFIRSLILVLNFPILTHLH
jgi:hypothetical protein